jgi:hypothetical protein
MNIHTSIAIEEMAVTMKQLVKELRGIREELWYANNTLDENMSVSEWVELCANRVKEWDDPKPE